MRIKFLLQAFEPLAKALRPFRDYIGLHGALWALHVNFGNSGASQKTVFFVLSPKNGVCSLGGGA